MKPAFLINKSLQQVVFIISIVLIFSGCNLIDDFIDDLKKQDPVASKTIGPSGGEIDFEGIILNIPEGAFAGDNEVSIIVEDAKNVFGEHGASSLFVLTGMPNETSKAIRIKIKYSGTLEGDPLIASGEMMYSVSLDSTLLSYQANEAIDSAGFLIYELPPYSKPTQQTQLKSGLPGNSFNFIAMNAYTLGLSSGGHFAISYPLSYDQRGIQMGEYLENAYDTCAKMGFSYRVGNSEYKWPARVMALAIAPSTGGYYTSWGAKTMTDQNLQGWVKDGDFTINTNILSNDNQLRTVCGHEFLHLVQNIYEFSSSFIEPEQDWLKEATAVWIMEKFSTTPNYYPSTLQGRETYLFNGWQNDNLLYEKSPSHSRHGYGMAALIKDIAEVYGDAAIVNIHKKIKDGILPGSAVDPVDAVLSVINEPVGNFWHGVLGSYLLGHYYNGQASTKIIQNLKSTTSIAGGFMISQDYSSQTFNHTYYDLSGSLYWISAGDLGSNKFPVSFVVDDPANCGILVCKYKAGGEIAPIGEVFPGGNGEVLIDDVKRVFDDGYELVVMVSNSTYDKTKNYQGTNEVNLAIGLVSGITSGRIEFFLDEAVFKRTDESSPYTVGLSEVLHLHDLNGRLNGNSYSGSYYYQSLGRTFSGTISLNFVENPDRVNLILNHSMSYQGNFGFGERKFHYTVQYSNIPYESYNTTSGRYIYSETGSSVSKISVSWKEMNSLYTNTLQSHNCGPASFIRVEVDSR